MRRTRHPVATGSPVRPPQLGRHLANETVEVTANAPLIETVTDKRGKIKKSAKDARRKQAEAKMES